MKHLHIHVVGRVQGVGFRYATQLLAQNLGIHGTVQNQTDGSVVIEAEGSTENLTDFLEEVRKSPTPYGKVTKIDYNFEDNVIGFNKFRVI
ncbi:acylphosphatase [Lactobacillus terrae]|uniref:acylphosphatase n=1 Tax=Lactobacillus terrae TaxID=2269374 RepID=UPI000C1B60C9|nr:acylphosphatase [Lactobacillus terrae]